jgi:hypothetical protein
MNTCEQHCIALGCRRVPRDGTCDSRQHCTPGDTSLARQASHCIFLKRFAVNWRDARRTCLNWHCSTDVMWQIFQGDLDGVSHVEVVTRDLQGTMSLDQIEEAYRISRRIEAEETSLDAALMVITSTQQEVELQWGLYDGYDEKIANALSRHPILGHTMPVMHVCPPGLDFSSLKVGAFCRVTSLVCEIYCMTYCISAT